MDDSIIICDEVIDSHNKEIKTIRTGFNEENITFKTQSFYILPAFLFATIALLITVSIYCYLTKYRAKNLLPFHDSKLKQFCIDSKN